MDPRSFIEGIVIERIFIDVTFIESRLQDILSKPIKMWIIEEITNFRNCIFMETYSYPTSFFLLHKIPNQT